MLEFRSGQHCSYLLDLPTSIKNAQGQSKQLVSPPAVTEPYPSTEPRGRKRNVLLASISSEEKLYHQEIVVVSTEALKETEDILRLKSSFGDDLEWCFPRILHQSESIKLSVQGADAADEIGAQIYPTSSALVESVPHILASTTTAFSEHDFLNQATFVNPHLHIVTLRVTTTGVSYEIPPSASFVLSHITSVKPSPFPPDLKFDFILLDPPWSNRSVRHARNKTYTTTEEQWEDPFVAATSILKPHLAAAGIVAIWTTNKWKVRKQVLDRMALLGLFLLEEWIWLKITSSGQPVMELDGIWRKPYEICLLFQQRNVPNFQRRIIIAVPDVHSRKPSLKSLIEPLLPAKYEALEVFARSLTAGWRSWGDEVLKFQETSHWEEPVKAK